MDVTLRGYTGEIMLRRLFSSREPALASTARVPDDCVVYAVGDIHGRADLLDRLHAKIAADAAARPQRRKVLVYLGDYVDRGHESRQVIDRLLAPPADGLQRVFLKGNHEDAMLGFLEDVSIGPAWMGFGGDATLLSYNVDVHAGPPDGVDRLAHIQARLLERLPADHREFLRRLVLSHAEGDYFFAHAGVRPGVALTQQTAQDLMWIRDDFLYSRKDFGKVVVHGHSIEMEPVVTANRIGIDTGAFATGVLTALVLEGAGRSFLKTP